MWEEDQLHEAVKDIRISLEIPEKKLRSIAVPPFVAGVRFFEFEEYSSIAEKKVALATPEGPIEFVRAGNWFYTDKDKSIEELQSLPEETVFLDPGTGCILRDVGTIDKTVQEYRTGSDRMMPLGGGNAIGRLHTLREKDKNCFGNYSSEDHRVSRYFIRTNKGSVRVLGKHVALTDVPQVGDRMIAVRQGGDNYFYFQVLRPDPTAEYELRTVQLGTGPKPKGPYEIGAYHMGQNVSPIAVALKRK